MFNHVDKLHENECVLCGKVISWKENMYAHIKNEHEKCDFCNSICYDIKDHIKQEHENLCFLCGIDHDMYEDI